VGFSFDPGVIAALAVAEVLYVRAIRVLQARGYEAPKGQQVAWHAGIAFTAVALLSPLDSLGDDLLVAHMGQHLMIADLGAPLLLVGVRSPVYAFLLPKPALVRLARVGWLRRLFRWLRRPLVAVPLWILILYGWHFRFPFESAIRHDWVHAAQHQSFVLGSVLVWWAVIEPKRRRAGGDLWKVPYLIGARFPGMMLGMAFILMRSVAYPDPYATRAPAHGWSAVTDQQVAGGMMMGTDLVVMLFAVCFFFYRSSEDHEQAQRAERAAVIT
jgi:cytochrome c oxidase assembly factor CtaG